MSKSEFDTNYAALGIPDPSPFDILSRPRATPKPHPAPKKKTQFSKQQQTINAVDTPEERRKKRELRHYKNSVSFDPTPQKSADKTQKIRGRL